MYNNYFNSALMDVNGLPSNKNLCAKAMTYLNRYVVDVS
jgi:hypothetical protein